VTHPKLQKYLNEVRAVFDVDKLASQSIDNKTIVDYYTQSDPGYSLFHSFHGSIHMALNPDGKFNREGYYEQARIALHQIQETGAINILELASGKGFNSIYLAEQFPDKHFVGIDLTPIHVETSRKAVEAVGLKNIQFQVGDFQNLQFPDASFDYVFVIESLCHACDIKLALENIHRVLKPSGQLMVIDGFRKKSLDTVSADESLAARIVEKSMAVGSAWLLNDFTKLAQEVGFKILETKDMSEAIMPNLERFQFMARGYFKYPWLSKFILKVSSPYLVGNAIAGLLMPIVVGEGIQGYFIISMRHN